jgi:hypothetical protein
MRTFSCLILAVLMTASASLALAESTNRSSLGGISQDQPGGGTSTQQQTMKGRAQIAQPLVSVDLVNTPIVEAVDRLFRGTGAKYQILSNVGGNVTLKLTNVPLSEAAAMLARAANIGLGRRLGVPDSTFYFARSLQDLSDMAAVVMPQSMPGLAIMPDQSSTGYPYSSPGQRGANTGLVNIAPSPIGTGKLFDLTLDQANIFEAVRQLMELAKVDYVIDLGQSPEQAMSSAPRISARLRNASLDNLLELFCRASNIHAEKSGSTYMIHWTAGFGGFGGELGRGGYITAPCPKCQKQVQTTWRFCPYCGAATGNNPSGNVLGGDSGGGSGGRRF